MSNIISKLKFQLTVLLFTFTLFYGKLSANNHTSAAPEATWFYIQIATSGTCDPIQNEPGYYTLKLQGVSPEMISFSNRPKREATVGTTLEFINDWYTDQTANNYRVNPPNATLALSSEKYSDMMVLCLENPVYDEKNKIMTYKVKPIEIKNDKKTETRLPCIPPQSFQKSILFIDDSWSSLGG